MWYNELVLVAALILLAFFGSLIGFPFAVCLGFTLALGLVFYLLQMGRIRKSGDESG